LAELDGSQNRRFGNGSCSTVFWWGHGGFDRLRSDGGRGVNRGCRRWRCGGWRGSVGSSHSSV
jgi:hypothetical protein